MTAHPGTERYDVVLSYAGEDRPYVAQVADELRASGVTVFYDGFEPADLWGKDYYTHLDEIYRLRGRFCVMFISRHYARKAWTNHERASAQARAVYEAYDYILPVRFDETQIPGLRPTVGYVAAADYPPEVLATLILTKLRQVHRGPDGAI